MVRQTYECGPWTSRIPTKQSGRTKPRWAHRISASPTLLITALTRPVWRYSRFVVGDPPPIGEGSLHSCNSRRARYYKSRQGHFPTMFFASNNTAWQRAVFGRSKSSAKSSDSLLQVRRIDRLLPGWYSSERMCHYATHTYRPGWWEIARNG